MLWASQGHKLVKNPMDKWAWRATVRGVANESKRNLAPKQQQQPLNIVPNAVYSHEYSKIWPK